MKEWKRKQVIDFDNSTTTVKEERNKTLHQTKLSIIFSFGYVTIRVASNYFAENIENLP